MAVAAVAAAETAPEQVHEFKLANGLHVVVIPDHRAPVVTQMVWYKAGAADEPPGASGIAHFLEHLMFKGTERIPTGAFSKIIARIGGDDNAFTNHDVTAYFQRVAKDRLEEVMEMEADRMVNLRLSEEDVETERYVILEERRSRVDNDPGSILQEQMMAALYRNHPYGIPIIGWQHEIEGLNREDAFAFYSRFYAPQNAILIVAGDVEPDGVKELAEKTFGKIPVGGEMNPRQRPKEPEHAAPVKVTLEDPRAGRITVQRYYIVPSYASADPGEAEALDLLARIATNGSTGRIYKRLVVQQKAAASAGGWYTDSGLDSGRLGFYAIAGDAHTVEEIETAMAGVIDELREKGVTQAELDRARAAHIAEFVYNADSISRMARQYGWRLSAGMTVADVQQWPERLKQVTVDDIRAVARKYLVDNNSVTGVLMPAPEYTSSIGAKPAAAAGNGKS
ncbi:MAG: M16 family metallopeptidase [Methyloceanibacter sp.]|uniref:M16 family metallopeptidase n=1 Tax=Methyloceanibacter sp. TaxID=1965321 RepID=UPI003D6CEFB7